MSNYKYLQPANTPFNDRFTTKAADIIETWDGIETLKGVGLLGAPLSKPSISHSGAVFAPGTIRKALQVFSTYSIEADIDLADWNFYDLGDVKMHVTNITESQTRIYKTFSRIFSEEPNFLPIVLGGDNSITFPSIQAFAKAKGKVGVIQFDAHHDVRNLEDGGPTNGTPFRSLLETKSIEGKHLVQVGIRDFSNSKIYREYCEEHGVSIYTMKDVRQRALLEIMEESIDLMKNEVDAIYVSLDMDVIDQSQAPGCPAIGPGGMDTSSLFEAIAFLGEQSLVKGLEIVEIDPTVDFRDMTSRVAAHVILNFLKGKQKGSIR
ncbi:formimidoylglutamase [Anaerobacillus arseniciselenatis]|uniref:Formimidoylglutamase n=1 Tax=Anaerobacillus arseniciselenatis TaxID=85682 RepID=A0A1S2LLI1_9BACI|nr:formimidoylglutamase [Anaerobacillus arseniciselenatis]OIJ12953.1 formimidoylglutamase [Anaerobacillus arseniciselenatis]